MIAYTPDVRCLTASAIRIESRDGRDDLNCVQDDLVELRQIKQFMIRHAAAVQLEDRFQYQHLLGYIERMIIECRKKFFGK